MDRASRARATYAEDYKTRACLTQRRVGSPHTLSVLTTTIQRCRLQSSPRKLALRRQRLRPRRRRELRDKDIESETELRLLQGRQRWQRQLLLSSPHLGRRPCRPIRRLQRLSQLFREGRTTAMESSSKFGSRTILGRFTTCRRPGQRRRRAAGPASSAATSHSPKSDEKPSCANVH
ncbi:hypothetical protein EJ04DRAFT_37135 [Polyplosphaeria fusca]|uniref:Uncharacterized protein n=1 Tax=Polyplosphaeria fusca TaxID=682080 RepID=A0A9P4UZV1_9PLEO|nr:hypothetical protein EJ04DRAFT_37135 [Polyplosphaeria fusca]